MSIETFSPAYARELEYKRFGQLMEHLPDVEEGRSRLPLSDLPHYLGVEMHSDPLEQLPLSHIVKTDHVILGKVLLALSVVTEEMRSLTTLAKTEFFNPLLFYGEGEKDHISRMLPLLTDLAAFGDHSAKTLENALGQLAAVHDKSKDAKPLISIGDSHFQVRHPGTHLY